MCAIGTTQDHHQNPSLKPPTTSPKFTHTRQHAHTCTLTHRPRNHQLTTHPPTFTAVAYTHARPHAAASAHVAASAPRAKTRPASGHAAAAMSVSVLAPVARSPLVFSRSARSRPVVGSTCVCACLHHITLGPCKAMQYPPHPCDNTVYTLDRYTMQSKCTAIVKIGHMAHGHCAGSCGCGADVL